MTKCSWRFEEGGTPRGGQCLTDGGLVVDTNELNRVQPLDRELVRAQGGAQWGQVVDALRGTRQLPPVLADIAEVTVGEHCPREDWGHVTPIRAAAWPDPAT